MDSVLNFSNTNYVGKNGVKIVEKYLKSIYGEYCVKNVEDSLIYRQKDIDLLVLPKIGRPIKIEVKTDRLYHTGNYFFETISNSQSGSLGCFMYTEADFIYCYYFGTNEIHIFKMPEARYWVQTNANRFKTVSTRPTPYVGGEYHSIGILIKREIVQDESKCIEIIKI